MIIHMIKTINFKRMIIEFVFYSYILDNKEQTIKTYIVPFVLFDTYSLIFFCNNEIQNNPQSSNYLYIH